MRSVAATSKESASAATSNPHHAGPTPAWLTSIDGMVSSALFNPEQKEKKYMKSYENEFLVASLIGLGISIGLGLMLVGAML